MAWGTSPTEVRAEEAQTTRQPKPPDVIEERIRQIVREELAALAANRLTGDA